MPTISRPGTRKSFHCHVTPSCQALLERPLEVLNTPSVWPTHLCVEALESSSAVWARQYAWQPNADDAPFSLLGDPGLQDYPYPELLTLLPRFESIAKWWVDLWPLPLGKQALLDFFQLDGPDESVIHLLPLVTSMPFDDSELAVLTLRLPIADGSLDLFLTIDFADGGWVEDLVDNKPDGLQVDRALIGKLRYRVQGRGELPASADDIVRAAQRWASTLCGRSMHRVVRGKIGRPSGSGKLYLYSLRQLQEAYAALWSDVRRQAYERITSRSRGSTGERGSSVEVRVDDIVGPPTVEAFAKKLGVRAAKTVVRRLQNPPVWDAHPPMSFIEFRASCEPMLCGMQSALVDSNEDMCPLTDWRSVTPIS